MKNINWQKPDGSFAVTSIADPAADSAAHAAHLKTLGTIPANWTVYSVDAAPPPKSNAELAAAQSDAAKRTLERIDLDSIRSIREYIAAKPDAPVFLKDLETAALGERVKVKV